MVDETEPDEPNPLNREPDVGDWRIINKKAECDQEEYEREMREREAQGLPRIPIKDWLSQKLPESD